MKTLYLIRHAKSSWADAIWSSPALRAAQTAHYLAHALNYPRKAIPLRDRLYTSSINEFLAEIRSCPDDVKGLLVIGHKK
jgi:phosphohistidine phosphatase SixA